MAVSSIKLSVLYEYYTYIFWLISIIGISFYSSRILLKVNIFKHLVRYDK